LKRIVIDDEVTPGSGAIIGTSKHDSSDGTLRLINVDWETGRLDFTIVYSDGGTTESRAARYDARIVTLGRLLLFSTGTGDAWSLAPSDQLATPLARDGDVLPVHIKETDTNFAIGWAGAYRIDGAAFVYWDKDSSNIRTILGYPTQ